MAARRLSSATDVGQGASPEPRLLGAAAVRSLAAAHGIRPVKHRGQNFVIDANTVRRIVRLAELTPADVVVEVGPGLGSLTLGLLPAACRVVAVEIDPVLASALPGTAARFTPAYAARLEVVEADALRIEAVPGPPPTALVANLPYNVAVPVLLHLFARLPSLRRTLVMVQAEVADRLAARPGTKAATLSAATIRNCLGTLRTFFERIIEWGYDDAPGRVPIFTNDLPRADEPLPRFLDDPTAAKFMASLAVEPNGRRRLVVELLARTGMRVGELCALEDDAMVRIAEMFWLRIPVGKLHNDRHVPLHPLLVDLITDYRARRGRSFSGRLVERDNGSPFDVCAIRRYVDTVAKRAGIGHVHPHQLRHTLATQAINRGMSLEAIAALLGHRSMRMTLTYARISDRTVAEQYFKVTEAVEARYQGNDPQPVGVDTDGTRQAAADAHRRLLGNGHCTRPVALDCQFESICERCGFFDTGPEFIPILRRQRDHATDQGNAERSKLFAGLLADISDDGQRTSFS